MQCRLNDYGCSWQDMLSWSKLVIIRTLDMRKLSCLAGWMLALVFLGAQAFADNLSPAGVTPQLIQHAKQNIAWKRAFLTAKNAQIVFMDVSSETNPKNEIGEETHPFDQVILIVTGKGRAIVNGKSQIVKVGDIIFIPEGTPHNVINLNAKKPLKIISFYSSNDMPAQTVYLKKSDEPAED